jgi:allophanate hydrolase
MKNAFEREENMLVAVAGLHLTGEPLNHQLTDLGATIHKKCFTSEEYKMYLLEDEKGRKPGLVRVNKGFVGSKIEVEVWSIPSVNFGQFMSYIPQPLGIGTLNLEDGSKVKGFICEPCGIDVEKDISSFGNWKSFLASKKQ